MKKKDVVNLIRYHVEKDEEAFITQAARIASEFDETGDGDVATFIMELISNTNFYRPQEGMENFRFLKKLPYSTTPLFLPSIIEEDVMGIINAVRNKSGLSKFLFYGSPGTGKTESAYQVARLLNYEIYYVETEQLIDSRLGETAKNVSAVFNEINHLPYNRTIVLFDEIDSLVLDRINKNDLREMGRVTSSFLKGLEALNKNIIIIATTNLYKDLDKAIVRRFDATLSFDRYSKEDLIEIADVILCSTIKKFSFKQDSRLFHKILRNLKEIPFPGDLKQIIQTAVAFSNSSNEYDYLRKIYMALNGNPSKIDLQQLKNQNYTTREIEILSRVPKSSVSRRLRRNLNESLTESQA